jgi:DNA-binding CsgD family transcriptional regulator
MTLSPKEIETLQLFAVGTPKKECASIAGISEAGLDRRLQKMRTTLGAQHNIALVHYALKTGIVGNMFGRK